MLRTFKHKIGTQRYSQAFVGSDRSMQLRSIDWQSESFFHCNWQSKLLLLLLLLLIDPLLLLLLLDQLALIGVSQIDGCWQSMINRLDESAFRCCSCHHRCSGFAAERWLIELLSSIVDAVVAADQSPAVVAAAGVKRLLCFCYRCGGIMKTMINWSMLLIAARRCRWSVLCCQSAKQKE